MTEFPGVVTLDQDNVHVMVGLEDDKISLVAGEVSIAEWLSGEYVVVDLGKGTFVIEAEEGSISFQPDDPGSFARGIGQHPEHDPSPGPAPARSLDTIEVKDGPRPRPTTVAGFYALVVMTTALGIWALLSLL
ncbi:MAG TPA: hypothetical protein VGC03_06905 [Acidimicrobiia bacterium]